PQIQNGETSADGGRIVYAQAAHDRWEVNVAYADGSGSAAVTTPDPVAYYLLDEVAHNVAPTWSPDGSQILFLSNRNGKWEFFVSDADGSNVRQVLENVTNTVTIKFD
ncbi:MAG: hypothetical protein M1482_15720, partial [Chloroflexi bacterium]|nr:hypothetical protein [Chloroflexota bacterium]